MSTTTNDVSPAERILALLDEHKPQGDYTRADVAARVAKELHDSQPELLLEWATDSLIDWLIEVMSKQDRSIRGHLRAMVRRQDFADGFAQANSAKDFENLKTTILDQWTVVVDDLFTVKPLGDCTWEDMEFAAYATEQAAKPLIAKGYLYRALQKKLTPGGPPINDVLAPEVIINLMKEFG